MTSETFVPPNQPDQRFYALRPKTNVHAIEPVNVSDEPVVPDFKGSTGPKTCSQKKCATPTHRGMSPGDLAYAGYGFMRMV